MTIMAGGLNVQSIVSIVSKMHFSAPKIGKWQVENKTNLFRDTPRDHIWRANMRQNMPNMQIKIDDHLIFYNN